MNKTALILVLLAGINSCAGNLLLKASRKGIAADAGFIQKMLSPLFIAGMFFYVVNVVLFAKALESAEVSVAYPVLAASGFAFLTIAAYFIFNEPLTATKLAGLAVVTAGIVLLARG